MADVRIPCHRHWRRLGTASNLLAVHDSALPQRYPSMPVETSMVVTMGTRRRFEVEPLLYTHGKSASRVGSNGRAA